MLFFCDCRPCCAVSTIVFSITNLITAMLIGMTQKDNMQPTEAMAIVIVTGEGMPRVVVLILMMTCSQRKPERAQQPEHATETSAIIWQ